MTFHTTLSISVFNSLEAAEDKWRRATRECASYGFQSYDWVSLCLATIGAARPVSPHIVHVADAEGRTVMMLPLATARRRGCRVLMFMGEGTADYNAPLIERNLALSITPAEFLDLWQRILAALPVVDWVSLRRMPDKVEGIPNPLLHLPGLIHTANGHAASLPSTFAAFKSLRSARLFADTRRKRRRLQEIGTVVFEVPEAPEEKAATAQLMIQQKEQRTGFPYPYAYSAFYQALATSTFETGRPHVSRLRVGDQIVATHVGLVFGDRFYWLMPGYEAGEWYKLSPGRILMESIIEWCIEKQLKIFDMTIGDEDYKRFWADSSIALYDLQVATTARGKAVLAARRLYRSPRIARIRAGLMGFLYQRG